MAWAREIAERQGLSDAQVLDAWKPYLTARAIWALGGRPPEERFVVLGGGEPDWPVPRT
jgi:hypothetical protein